MRWYCINSGSSSSSIFTVYSFNRTVKIGYGKNLPRELLYPREWSRNKVWKTSFESREGWTENEVYEGVDSSELTYLER